MKKINTLLKLLLFVILIISVCLNSKYNNFSLFSKIIKGPILEFYYLFTVPFSKNIAFLITLISGLILIVPSIRTFPNEIKKIITAYKKMAELKNKKIDWSLEKTNKINQMLDIYEKEEANLGKLTISIYSIILLSVFLNCLINIRETANVKTLWFYFNEKDLLLFTLSCLLVFSDLIINFLSNDSEKKRKNLFIIIRLLISSVFLYYSYNNCTISLVVIITYLINFLYKERKIKYEKTINKN